MEAIRSYSVEGGLTFGKFGDNTIDITASGKVERTKADSRTAGFAQAKVNLYLTKALTIPLALTYSSALPGTKMGQWRLNVGLSVNGDAVLGAARD